MSNHSGATQDPYPSFEEIFVSPWLTANPTPSGVDSNRAATAAAGMAINVEADDDSDYDEVERDGDSDASFYSEGEELAEYWDPYREQRASERARKGELFRERESVSEFVF